MKLNCAQYIYSEVRQNHKSLHIKSKESVCPESKAPRLKSFVVALSGQQTLVELHARSF